MATKRKWYQKKTVRAAIFTGIVGTVAVFPPTAVIPVIGITVALAAKILTLWGSIFIGLGVADRAGKPPENME